MRRIRIYHNGDFTQKMMKGLGVIVHNSEIGIVTPPTISLTINFGAKRPLVSPTQYRDVEGTARIDIFETQFVQSDSAAHVPPAQGAK